jgi:intracellular sulfur oxidation DsrE/DsrF family protein
LSTRRDFIAASSSVVLLPATAGATPAPAPAAAAELQFTFDQTRFDAILRKPARHKQCFGATKIAGGEVLALMLNSIKAYDDYLKEGASALQTVAVLYHGNAIGLALSDTAWNELLVPFLQKTPVMAKDIPEARPGKGNPYLVKQVPDLVRRGASFLVCHNAIAGVSYAVSETLGQPAEQVHAALMAAIVPGALVVPAGVMAINACQEAHFTYLQTSV